MESRFEIIDAFMDGERVDAAALKRALAESEGRDYLVDAWLLREGIQEDMALETAVTAPPRRARGPRPWLLAAAMLLCVAGAYLIGYRNGGVLPPKPTATATAPAVTPTPTSAPTAKSFPVPPATRVIQVDFAASAAGSGGN